MDKITVSAEPLAELLRALVGPSHLIRELQATRSPIFETNPINILIAEYNDCANKETDEPLDRAGVLLALSVTNYAGQGMTSNFRPSEVRSMLVPIFGEEIMLAVDKLL